MESESDVNDDDRKVDAVKISRRRSDAAKRRRDADVETTRLVNLSESPELVLDLPFAHVGPQSTDCMGHEIQLKL